MSVYSQKVRVKSVSLESLSAVGWDLDDGSRAERELFGSGQAEWLMGCLTRRQQQVVRLLCEGYTRRETAAELAISLQAVHQIVPRIRHRLRCKAKLTLL